MTTKDPAELGQKSIFKQLAFIGGIIVFLPHSATRPTNSLPSSEQGSAADVVGERKRGEEAAFPPRMLSRKMQYSHLMNNKDNC